MTLESTPILELPICADCAHLVGVRHYSQHSEAWKCHAKQNIEASIRSPVTGDTIHRLRFATCHTAREDVWQAHPSSERALLISCGEVGQWFEKYEHPRSTKEPPANLAEELLKELK